MELKININPLYASLIIYAIIVASILHIKPLFLFDKNGNIKCTGFGCKKSLFSFPIFIVLLSIITYFTITVLFTGFTGRGYFCNIVNINNNFCTTGSPAGI